MLAKNERITYITAIILLSIGFIGFTVKNFRENIEFYYSISEIPFNIDKKIRIGGLVVKGSINYKENNQIEFKLADKKSEVLVYYNGVIPDLFREGQGIIATGIISKKVFIAEILYAKHDENYKPKIYNQ